MKSRMKSRGILYDFKQAEKQKADEVKKNNLKNGQIKCQKNGNDSQDKVCFVMDRGQKPFGQKHDNNDRQKGSFVKPVKTPAEIHRQTD